jgi:hypothetical protein
VNNLPRSNVGIWLDKQLEDSAPKEWLCLAVAPYQISFKGTLQTLTNFLLSFNRHTDVVVVVDGRSYGAVRKQRGHVLNQTLKATRQNGLSTKFSQRDSSNHFGTKRYSRSNPKTIAVRRKNAQLDFPRSATLGQPAFARMTTR